MQLELRSIGYSYNGKELVLRHVNYRFEGDRVYAITGRSGAGKTTLLSLLPQLAKSVEGKILYNGLDVNEVDQYLHGGQYTDMIFQSFNPLARLTAVENMMLSMDITGVKKEDNRAYAVGLLKKVRLSKEESRRRILKFFGGQQQRVVITRTVSYDPSVLLMDEPTRNLDEGTQDRIVEIFKGLAYKEQKYITLVMHSPVVVSFTDEACALTDTRKAGNRQKGV